MRSGHVQHGHRHAFTGHAADSVGFGQKKYPPTNQHGSAQTPFPRRKVVFLREFGCTSMLVGGRVHIWHREPKPHPALVVASEALRAPLPRAARGAGDPPLPPGSPRRIFPGFCLGYACSLHRVLHPLNDANDVGDVAKKSSGTSDSSMQLWADTQVTSVRCAHWCCASSAPWHPWCGHWCC